VGDRADLGTNLQADDPPRQRAREFEAFLRDMAVSLVSRQAGLVEQHVGKPRDPSSTESV
jgi:hypothetical protein